MIKYYFTNNYSAHRQKKTKKNKKQPKKQHFFCPLLSLPPLQSPSMLCLIHTSVSLKNWLAISSSFCIDSDRSTMPSRRVTHSSCCGRSSSSVTSRGGSCSINSCCCRHQSSSEFFSVSNSSTLSRMGPSPTNLSEQHKDIYI